MMKSKEAISVIKNNYPPENYTMLREALDLAIGLLEDDATKEERCNHKNVERWNHGYHSECLDCGETDV